MCYRISGHSTHQKLPVPPSYRCKSDCAGSEGWRSLDARTVRVDAIELDRAGKIGNARGIGVNVVSKQQRTPADRTGTRDTGNVSGDVLILYLTGQLYAGRIAAYGIDARSGNEAEPAGTIVYRGDDPGRVERYLVAA